MTAEKKEDAKKKQKKKTEKEEDEKIHQVTDAAKGTLLQAHTHTHKKKKASEILSSLISTWNG